MLIRNPFDEARYLPAVRDVVEPGAVVDVDEATGVSLLEQGWEPDSPSASKAELAEAAAALGVDVKKSWTAERIQKAIDDARAEQAAAAGDEGGQEPETPTTEADPADSPED